MARWIVYAVSIALAACHTLDTKHAAPLPARLGVSNGYPTIEINRAITTLLYGRSVAIDKDAFTTQSVILIERSTARSLNRAQQHGRITELPLKISLLLRNGQCWLTREDTGKQQRLTGVNCIALKH